MSVRIRSVVLYVIAAVTATSASGQDAAVDYFPHEVGNRWVYDVQGTTSAGDTLDARTEWTVAEVRPAAEADTVVIDAVRTDSDGRVWSNACTVVHAREDYTFLRGITPPGLTVPEHDAYRAVCLMGGGFPFSDGGIITSRYPYLYDLTQSDTSDVIIGSVVYSRGVATASFDYGTYVDTRNQRFHSTNVSSRLAEGIGLVETVIAENREFQQLDTVRVTLVGAEIGGVMYGDIGAVRVEDKPDAVLFNLRAGPNPSRGVVTATVLCSSWCPIVDLTLLDAQGRTLMSQQGRDATPSMFDLSRLPSGVYAIRAESNGEAVYRLVSLIR